MAEESRQMTIEELARAAGLELVRTEQGLGLTDGVMTLRGDLAEMLPRLRRDNLQREMLVRAARIREFSGEMPAAVDATAGLGEDSILLAAAGFYVRMYEYNPVTAALLADALERARMLPELAEIAGRMELIPGDSVAALRAMAGEEKKPDVVLLDPMFPAKQKRSLTNKKLQLLQRLEQPCAKEEEILQAAMAAGPQKIVIKRPVKGPYLAGARPGYSITGKTVRYDCIVCGGRDQ